MISFFLAAFAISEMRMKRRPYAETVLDDGERENENHRQKPVVLILFSCACACLYAASAFAFTRSMIFLMPNHTVTSVKTSTMLPRSVNGGSCKSDRSFTTPFFISALNSVLGKLQLNTFYCKASLFTCKLPANYLQSFFIKSSLRSPSTIKYA